MEEKYKLLLVEHEPHIIQLFGHWLGENSIGLDVVKTGYDSVRSLGGGSYDAVVLKDLLPPGGNEGSGWHYEDIPMGLDTGLRVLEYLDGLRDGGRNVPLAWMHASVPDTSTKERVIALPFVAGYIEIPYSVQGFAEGIRNCLDERL